MVQKYNTLSVFNLPPRSQPALALILHSHLFWSGGFDWWHPARKQKDTRCEKHRRIASTLLCHTTPLRNTALHTHAWEHFTLRPTLHPTELATGWNYRRFQKDRISRVKFAWRIRRRWYPCDPRNEWMLLHQPSKTCSCLLRDSSAD